jgi:hypothetical protein
MTPAHRARPVGLSARSASTASRTIDLDRGRTPFRAEDRPDLADLAGEHEALALAFQVVTQLDQHLGGRHVDHMRTRLGPSA